MLFSFYICSLYFQSFFPVPISYFRASLSQLVSVTHLHLGSLVHGRGSSLDWARLPLTSPCASGAGLHCLHLHTQHALFIYLYLLAPPLTILWCTCLVLLFLCKPLRFPLCLFVCWTKLILIGSCQCLQSQSGY